MHLLILLLFAAFNGNLYAENTQRLYCFQGENLKEVSAYLGPILKKNDIISRLETSNCLKVTLSAVRIPLFDSWIARKYKFKNKISSHSFGANSINASECRLELINKSLKTSATNKVNFGKKTNFTLEKENVTNLSRSRFLVTEGKPFSLQVNNQKTFITCYKSGLGNYKIKISLRSDHKTLTTSLVLVKGQESNMSTIVKNLNQKNRKIDLNRGVELKDTKLKQNGQYFLKIY